MIHLRRTVQIAPGMQADAVARMHEWTAIYKEATGFDIRVSVVTTGTRRLICSSGDNESMAHKEGFDAKGSGSPKRQALGAKQDQEWGD